MLRRRARYALVVGVNDYDHPDLAPLKWPADDAAALRDALQSVGYETALLSPAAAKKSADRQPTKANVESWLKWFLAKTTPADTMVVALAGRGYRPEGGAPSFCPRDAVPRDDRADTLVSLSDVCRRLGAAKAGGKFLIVDAAGLDGLPRPPDGVAALVGTGFARPGVGRLRPRGHVRRGRQDAPRPTGRVGQPARRGHLGAVAVERPRADRRRRGPADGRGRALAGPPAVVAPFTETGLAADWEKYAVPLNATGSGLAALREAGEAGSRRWAAAARAGAQIGMAMHGFCLANGLGGPADDKRAVEWLRKAADAGFAGATNSLGLAYAFGRGVPASATEAVRWYRTGAEAGFAPAMASLASAYLRGAGAAADDKEAWKWYRKAADAGNAVAMFNVGWMAQYGRGTKADEKEAVAWYRRGADKGNGGAAASLGYMWEFGKGTPKDAAEAVRWYRRGAELGSSVGATNLGWLTETGVGTPKDEKLAAEWYRKGAELGEARAMNNLGVLSESGRGVAKDIQKALTWYRKAAATGYAASKDNLKRLGKE